jgi:hypothetical protein
MQPHWFLIDMETRVFMWIFGHGQRDERVYLVEQQPGHGDGEFARGRP